jgi:hypothetical protein
MRLKIDANLPAREKTLKRWVTKFQNNYTAEAAHGPPLIFSVISLPSTPFLV